MSIQQQPRSRAGKKIVAIVGGGVIGGGWAARFLLHGWDVRVFDPDPDAPRKISEVVANAQRSLPLLADVSMPTVGNLVFSDSIEDAVAEADWVQESVPERLEIKHRTFEAIFAAAPQHTLIGSSTSGFKPSELQQGVKDPSRLMVAHPFNPVYLLPLVELVPGDAAVDERTSQARALLRSIGMKPLLVRKEIDAHLADRFLEAVWREGLWLIKDEIATTEEIDDAIRFGFGLRWAQMGLFETYRIAGGEAGMAHFIAQFGPCLEWPWTKLMDVPELDQALIDKIAQQSDAQSGQYSIRELERIRDDNLVGIMQALKQNNFGAGEVLNQHDRQLARLINHPAGLDDDTESLQSHLQQTLDEGNGRPLFLHRGRVLPSWLDYNQHMTEARYFAVCSEANAILFEQLGLGKSNTLGGTGHSFYAVETHMQHQSELNVGEAWHTATQVLSSDDKRLRLVHCLYATEDERLAATCEQLFLHIDTKQKAACTFSDPAAQLIALLTRAHAGLPIPDGVGRHVGQERN